VSADGTLDPAQVGSGWRKPQRHSSLGADTAPAVKPADKRPSKRAAAQQATGEGGQSADAPEVNSFAGHRLKEAVAHKADYDGKLKELEYLERVKQLIDVSIARKVFFDEFRAARDAWLNWPSRFAALIAADLGVEADRVAEVLTAYVHKQLALLAEPGDPFTS